MSHPYDCRFVLKLWVEFLYFKDRNRLAILGHLFILACSEDDTFTMMTNSAHCEHFACDADN